MCNKKNEKGDEDMATAEAQVTLTQQLNEAMKEVQDKQNGKHPKGSAFDMIKSIRKDMENGKL